MNRERKTDTEATESGTGEATTTVGSDVPARHRSVRRLVAAGLAISSLCAAGTLLVGTTGALAGGNPTVPGAAQQCTALVGAPEPSGTSGSSSGGADSTAVTVVVPSVVDVVLASDGTPELVRTNTNAAPSCTDEFWIFANSGSSTGSPRPADLSEVNQVMEGSLSGAWPLGPWHSVS